MELGPRLFNELHVADHVLVPLWVCCRVFLSLWSSCLVWATAPFNGAPRVLHHPGTRGFFSFAEAPLADARGSVRLNFLTTCRDPMRDGWNVGSTSSPPGIRTAWCVRSIGAPTGSTASVSPV